MNRQNDESHFIFGIMILQNSEPLELLNLLNNASHVQNKNAYMYRYFISEL